MNSITIMYFSVLSLGRFEYVKNKYGTLIEYIFKMDCTPQEENNVTCLYPVASTVIGYII